MALRLLLLVLGVACLVAVGAATSQGARRQLAAAPTIQVVFENESFATLAVDRNGVAYGKSNVSGDPTGNYRLYRSQDEGRTWTAIFDFPAGSLITYISVLSNGTLLAHVNFGDVRLFRSDDGGLTWTQVFRFPAPTTTLSPHSLTDDGSYVYVGSYIPTPTPGGDTNYIWRSSDDGRTWAVIYTTTSPRHIHFVQVDPYTGDIYVGYGDSDAQSAIARSSDHGVTWQTICPGSVCTAVDIAFDPSGFAIFGQDHVYQNGFIIRLDLSTGTPTQLAQLPGPSYSAFHLGALWLVGETHEPQGTIFSASDLNLHLFASNDGGQTFTDVFQRPYRNTTGYERLSVQFAYPNGDFPIQISGYGTIVAHLASAGAINSPPSVSMTSPAPNTTFTQPAPITINADAADSDGSVSKVDFYAGTTLLATDTTSPYSFVWNNMAAGSYTLTARATDNGGATGTSSPINITVLPPPAGTGTGLAADYFNSVDLERLARVAPDRRDGGLRLRDGLAGRWEWVPTTSRCAGRVRCSRSTRRPTPSPRSPMMEHVCG